MSWTFNRALEKASGPTSLVSIGAGALGWGRTVAVGTAVLLGKTGSRNWNASASYNKRTELEYFHTSIICDFIK